MKKWGDAVGVGLTPMRASIGLVSQLGSVVTGLGYTLGGIGLALGGMGAAIVGPIGLALHSFAEGGSELLRMSERTGIAVAALGELKYAATQSGVGMGSLEMAIRRTQQAVAKAGEAKGGKGGAAAKAIGSIDVDEGGVAELALSGDQAAEAIGKLGVNLQKLQGMSSEEQFLALARAVGQIGDQSQKTRTAMDLWGRSGTQLLPLLGDVDALRARFRQLNLGTSRESAEAAQNLERAYNDLAAVMKKIGSTVASVLAPAVTDLLSKQAESLSQVITWTKAHKDVVVAAALAGGALVGLGTAFGVAGAATLAAGSLITTGATLATAAVGGLSLVLGIASGAMALVDASAAAMTPLLASLAPAGVAAAAGETAVAAGATLIDVAMGGLPLIIGAVVVGLVALGGVAGGLVLLTGGALVAALVAGGAAWLYWSRSAHEAVGGLADEFKGLLGTFKASWGGIVDAITSGDVGLAAKIAWLSFEVGFLQDFPNAVRQFTMFTALLATGFAVLAAHIEMASNSLEALFALLDDPAHGKDYLDIASRANEAIAERLKRDRRQIAEDAAATIKGSAEELKRAAEELKNARQRAFVQAHPAEVGTVIGGLGMAALGVGGGAEALGGAGGAAKDAMHKISAVGTFNAAAIFGLGGGGPLEGIERNTAAANGHLKKIAAQGRFKIV